MARVDLAVYAILIALVNTLLLKLPAAAECLAQRDHRLEARQFVLTVLIACGIQGPLRFEHGEEISCAFTIAQLGALEGTLTLSQSLVLEVSRVIEIADA